ncbi:MAG: hypothetical protein ACT4O5_12410 [Gammaproteobacteria bacterium]
MKIFPALRLIDDILAREKRITIVKTYYPASAIREKAVLRTVTFREMPG